ncbi:glycine betaine uptake BCCT transporter [Fictibacillus phosphorivorans]|uniref:glycine betaine uptake BCCT transporter n=1 Tax=Fictibacillus phosphorivorans TaxID=1221500 RepID=UPI0020403D58|nr:BCCT family transporter [Fictibacillus phosphorivorans]MCM3717318.1 BCCT family transporter [Fictibacillus phosphorivorans]MCM3775006.1 BCCT family transporter [Fictibacillus phosphorivorans]
MKKTNTVFIVSLLISVVFIVIGFLFPEELQAKATTIQNFLQEKFGWFYLLSATSFLIFVLYLAFSKFGKIKLGEPDDKPEYSMVTWFAMLFSAGMGIGLVFWGVAEPISHFYTPPSGEGGNAASAQAALRYSFFHWGLHPWGIYTLIGLSLAYFKFRKGAPGLISAIFTPLIGDKVNGPIGKTIDIVAVFATIFGVATSLGLGAVQISGGLSYVTNIANNFTTQLIIIAVVTVLFTVSAQTGLDKGIKYLSNLNIILAIILMLFLLFASSTNFIMDVFVQSLGNYLQFLPSMSLKLSPFVPSEAGWIQGWTVFYWAWWIAWAPFVGTFIARVSKGRTIREFVLGVLLVPTLFGALWFSIFGGAALHLEIFDNIGLNKIIADKGTETALFAMLEHLPFGFIMSLLAIFLISTFFITSADSATFVLGMQTRHGRLEPSSKIKFVWGMVIAAAAAILLYSGGLEALQTASIIAAFPFAFVLIFMMISLQKALSEEKRKS